MEYLGFDSLLGGVATTGGGERGSGTLSMTVVFQNSQSSELKMGCR